MGYSTDFTGRIDIAPRLNDDVIEELNEFFEARHDSPRYPGIWCDLSVANVAPNTTELSWNGSEKTYYLAEWIAYVIDHFLKPLGAVANGSLDASGEEPGDLWRILVEDNVVSTQNGSVSYA